MSISKLSAAAVNASLEIQPALANINFDFSLWKVEAPKEFEGVGAALTTFRRNEAENGCTHMTARKLGALFDRLLPHSPELIKAYGQRASEISQSSSINAEGRSSYGVFASRVGADATSLWAAATSGSSAVCVHLLACMLARIWDGPEATSIWVEIIERRKKEVQDDFDRNNVADLATLAAARQELTRNQISEWDASARAWLRAADFVKCRQQKQLMLILDNVQSPVNKKTDTYGSVMSAWTNALTQMEGLIKGVSQQAQGGDIVLALSAWHLFPDLMVVTPRTAQVYQKDPIFANGAVLTIGLDIPDVQHPGVYWSLPLAHLRHYGAPVVSSRSIDSTERSRISTEELLQATLGCLLHGWDDAGMDTTRCITWLNTVLTLLERAESAGFLQARTLIRGNAEFSWFNLMLTAAKQYLMYTDEERKRANKLILLGRKHGKSFLGRPADSLFGLLDGKKILPTINPWAGNATSLGLDRFSSTNSPTHVRGAFVALICTDDDKINLLRQVASHVGNKMGLEPDQIFIRYKRLYAMGSKSVYEYATALPWPKVTSKRKRDQTEEDSWCHRRWLYAGGGLKKRAEDSRYHERLVEHFSEPKDWKKVPGDFVQFHRERNSSASLSSDRDDFTAEQQESIYKEFESRRRFYQSLGEDVDERESQLIEDFGLAKMNLFWDKMGRQGVIGYETPWYRLVYGDQESAGLFIIESRYEMLDILRPRSLDAEDFFRLFETGKIDAKAIAKELLAIFQLANAETDPHLKSLKALSTAAIMYRRFINASVDIRVLQQSLFSAAWVQGSGDIDSSSYTPSSLQPYYLDREAAFACIAMFESGRYDISPTLLKNVMAMSSGDSIYIGGALLADPIDESSSEGIKHVLGNIGRPGIAFLVPPVDPLIREVEMSDWSRICREPFDGELRDCFESTSLHLSFTGASSPVNVGFSGGQDVDAYMLETVISIRECGTWIADLDIFKAFSSVKLFRLGLCEDDRHTNSRPIPNLVAIDNWFGLIDAPEDGASIIRARKNWQARLAATTLSVTMGYETLVVSDKVCWCCLDHLAKQKMWGRLHKVIIIG